MIQETDIKLTHKSIVSVGGAAIKTLVDDFFGVRKEIIERDNETTERFYVKKNKGVFKTLKDAVDFLNQGKS